MAHSNGGGMMTQTSAEQRGIRWGVPIVIGMLDAAALAFAHFSERVETNVAFWLTVGLTLVTPCLLAIWFVRERGIPARVRRRGAIVFLALLGAGAIFLKFATRVDGTLNGVGIPKLAWRWSPREAGISSMPAVEPGGPPADLADTTPQDSPEFLGPGRRNHLEGVGLSRDWSQPPKKLWRQPIGLGWSSFAVVGNYAVTQEQRGTSELTVCYELLTGKPRWEHAHPQTQFGEWQGGDGPRATPTIDAGRVYAVGATGIFDCLDGATGSLLWSHDLVGELHGSNQTYGKACSPLVTGDLVIVTGPTHGPSLVAYSKSDGRRVWPAGVETPGYASPVLSENADARQIVTINGGSVEAFDPTGRSVWRFDWPGMMPKNTQPIPLAGDRVLISAGYGLGTKLLHVPSAGTSGPVQTLWSSPRLKPKFSNNVVSGNCVFGLDDGTLTCLDLSTGKRLWRGENYGFGQILGVDDLLLVQAESGEVALVEAKGDAFHELGRFGALDSKTWAQPVLSGHHLLVRNDRESACYELP